MTDDRRLASRNFHPLVYEAMLALAYLLVLSIWGFAGTGETDFQLAVATVFIVIAVALPLVVLRIWWTNRGRSAAGGCEEPFRRWASRDFETGQGILPGKEAAIQALLPIAAVAFGMTAFALVGAFVR